MLDSFIKFSYGYEIGYFGQSNENFMKKRVRNMLNFTANFSKHPIMAEKKIEKTGEALPGDCIREIPVL